jgi:hypothetical protein
VRERRESEVGGREGEREEDGRKYRQINWKGEWLRERESGKGREKKINKIYKKIRGGEMRRCEISERVEILISVVC